MNPILFALRRPVTVMMLALALALGGSFSIYRMQKDIFPSLNQPVLYIVHSYGGMDPKQVEGLITNVYETLFQYISGLEHVESKSIQSMVVLKLYFQPGTDMAEATANTVAYANKAVSIMPVGAQPPFVIRLDAGSLPVGYLVFSSTTKTIGQMQDMAMYRVRPIFASLPGTMSPPPFGGNIRTIVVNLDPDRLRSYNLSPQDVVAAIDQGNYASPSGNVTIKDQMAVVPANTMVLDPQELRNVPLKLGENVYIRDVGTVSDSTDIPTGYALINGRKSVYIPVVKRADASTLTVVNEVKANLPRFQAALPDDIKVDYQFDESPIVHRAIESVGVEGALGAGLTGLMVLLFLRDIRSVIVVVLNIPLALLGAIIVLDLTGNTINIMTLGGLALAIGILVDEATVEIENIHTQMEHTPSIARAVRQGNMETAVPRLLALLCILSVFIPSFIMQGAVRALFVPLSLAVGASMVTSYLLSSTLVPVLSVWLLQGHEQERAEAEAEARPGLFARFQRRFDGVVEWTVAHRGVVVLTYLAAATGVIAAVGSQLGRELFPRVDAGQFQMRVRPPQGTQFELTRQVAEKALDVIADEAGPENVEITMGYIGAIPPMFTVNLAYQWSRGSDDSMLRVGLKHGSKINIFELQERLRKAFPEKVGPWFREELLRLGVTPELADRRSREIVFAFEPGDLISSTMSLGSPAPIEVVVSGRNLDDSSGFMDQVKAEIAKVPSLRDLQIQQTLHYPTVQVVVDRQRAGLSGVTAHDIGDSLIAATYSSRYTSRNYWRDDASGTSYQVQVQVPPVHMTDATDVAQIPLSPQVNRRAAQMAMSTANPSSNPSPPLLLRDVAMVMRNDMPGEIDRYNMRRYLSLTANVEGEDLGRAIDRVELAIKAAGNPPKGVEVDMRGQVKPMRQMFLSLEIGLGVAVIVILIMLTAYFQSFRLALTAVASVPAVLAGVVLALYLTGTTLNIESFMGAIMAVGVAVSNAILLVSFGDRHRLEDRMEPAMAAMTAAKGRLRPILMTSCAMISGMIPMSLALEEGSEQNAPLGRAVMGGMASATFATLLVLPAVFTYLMSGASKQSASLDPDDPDSPHYDPDHAPGQGHAPGPDQAPTRPGRTGPPPAASVGIRAAVRIQPPRSRPPTMPMRRREAPPRPARARWAIGPVVALALASGCGHKSSEHAAQDAPEAARKERKTLRVERRDISMHVDQPGTVQAFESTPIFARIGGYVDQYKVNIGDRVKGGDTILSMWIPDLVEAVNQKKAATDRAQVQIRVAQSGSRSAKATLENSRARIVSAEAGVKRAQAAYTRWDSESKRLNQLVVNQVLNSQVRDETYRQFEEAAAARDQADAAVNESIATRDKAQADLERADVDIEAARADLSVAQSEQRQAQVMVDYGAIKAPYDGVITQRNVSPGDYLQPGGGNGGRPLFVLEQTDPVRVFVGVPELAAGFIKDDDTALIRIQAVPGSFRRGKIVRSGFSLNPSSRTLQTEIDIPNADGHLRPGMYVTVTVTIDRKQVFAAPSSSVVFLGGQSYALDLQIGGKVVRTPVLIGPSDDQFTEILRKKGRADQGEDWITPDGNEQLAGPGTAGGPASPSTR